MKVCVSAVRAFAQGLENITTVRRAQVVCDTTHHVQATIDTRHIHPDVAEFAANHGFAVDLSESDARIDDHKTIASVRFVPYRVQPTTIE
jgi:hypothetical protein